MYITRVQLTNIRALHELDLHICDEDGKPRMHTAIIGINGTCKTTLLRSIAIGLCGAADANALLAELAGTLMTLGEPDAQIIIDIIVPH